MYDPPMNEALLETVKALPLTERIELVAAIWDSITGEEYEPSLSPAEVAELHERLADHRKNPEASVPWEQIKADLDKKYPSAS